MEWKQFMNSLDYNFKFTSFFVDSFLVIKDENTLQYTYILNEYKKNHSNTFDLNDLDGQQEIMFQTLLKLHNDAKVLKLLSYIFMPLTTLFIGIFLLDVFINNSNLFDFTTDTLILIGFICWIGSCIIVVLGGVLSRNFTQSLVIYELQYKFNNYYKKNIEEEIKMNKVRDLTILMIQDIREGKETIFENQLISHLKNKTA